jgi:hypothetical protein
MAREQVNEKSAYRKTMTVLDAASAAVTPSTLRYRVDCVTTQTQVQDWVTLTPAASVTILVAAALNSMVNPVNPTETKRVTVQADYETDSQVVGLIEYDVLNSDFYS